MVENMSSKHKWRINVRNLETNMRVGCDPKERDPQRIRINVMIEGEYDFKPDKLDQCINYDVVYKFVTQEWPKLPHTILLETRVNDLLEYIFRSDDRVAFVRASLEKPDIFHEVESVGIETEWTREDYERYSPK